MEAVIFDLDGVLVDSFEAWYDATSAILKSINKTVSKKEYRKKYWGLVFKDAARKFGLKNKEKIEELSEKHNKIFENNLDKVKVKPHATQTIKNLKQKGIKTAIVSNSPKKVIKEVLERFDMNFDVVIGSGKSSKPSSKGINRVLNILKVSKENAIYIGDTETDEKAGNNAGIKTLIVGKDIEDLRAVLDFV